MQVLHNLYTSLFLSKLQWIHNIRLFDYSKLLFWISLWSRIFFISVISVLRHGQMMGIQKWQLNWAPNLESGYVTGTIGIAEWMNWMILNWTSQIGAILIYSFVFPNARSSVNLDLKIYIYSCFTFSGSLSASFWTI